MTTFAKALARIEELQGRVDLRYERYDSLRDINELITLLRHHADSIVQLAKVAKEMRAVFAQRPDFVSSYDDVFYAVSAYDELMNGGEAEK